MLIQKALPNCVIDGTASDGAEAIELIKKSPPDIVITDIKMPVCNGLELSRFLYENYPNRYDAVKVSFIPKNLTKNRYDIPVSISVVGRNIELNTKIVFFVK